ncbi:MAG: UPF0182 family protein, partial [Bacillota bacterium]|nr:UPF0182 family protein [Bacillota bacterium]
MGFDFSNFNKDGEGNFSDIFKKKDVIKGNFDKKKFKKPLIILGIIVVVIILAIIACNIYLEAIQYNEIGNLSSIYFTNLKYKVIFSVLCFILIFVLISVTNMFINKNMRLYRKERGLEDKKYPNYIIAAIFTFIGALVCKDLFYDKAISFLNAVDFGKQAPVIGKDIGYFIFQRPFFMVLYDFISTLWILVIIYTVIYYLIALTTSMNLNGGSLTLQDLKIKTLIRHNIINIAIFFIIKAVSYKFQREGIVYSNVVGVKGASYVDVHIWLNYFTIAPFLLLAIVVAAFLFIWKGKLKRAAISIAVFPAVWLLVTIGAAIYQGLIVSPNIISYENNYIKNNMQETRQAYGIDNIKTVNFQNMGVLNQDVLNKNQDTVNNIRVVDYQSTLESDTQLQSIKTFYDFHDGDIINYNIGGKDIPIFISAREIDKNKLPDNANTYVNRTFRYTHGYGVVVNPINTLAHEGQVNFLLNGLDMKSSDMTVKQPRIYYGEMTNDDVIANANGLKEIDYDGSKDTTYTGKGGIKLNLFNRLLFALRNQDFNMLVSGYVSS